MTAAVPNIRLCHLFDVVCGSDIILVLERPILSPLHGKTLLNHSVLLLSICLQIETNAGHNKHANVHRQFWSLSGKSANSVGSLYLHGLFVGHESLFVGHASLHSKYPTVMLKDLRALFT